MKNSLIILLAAFFSGCVHMHSSPPPAYRRPKEVEAEGYRFIFLLLNFDNRYVNKLTEDLAKQCPGGRVEGILTKTEGITYFPVIAHGMRVTAKGTA